VNNSNLFRKRIKAEFPHVKVSIRRVSFQDLARADRLCLTASGDRPGELREINRIAESFNIIPDGNVRLGGEAVLRILGVKQ